MNIKFTRDWINSIPKVININGCWIPIKRPEADGYVRVATGKAGRLNHRRWKLHRIVMCIYNNVDYDNKEIESRHTTNCSRACFNPEHIKPGTKSDNVKDSVSDRTHRNAAKLICGICGATYSLRTRYGKIVRHCKICNRRRKAGFTI